MSEPTHFPLCWPDTMPRKTGTREPGLFKTSLADALENVQTSLRLFGRDSGKLVRNVVISSNVTLGHARPDDSGVAVWFTWEDQSICIPVDRYSKVEANLQAIHHVLEARRVELRHGTLALVRATMKGFIALPSNKRPWRDVFNIQPGLPVTTGLVETLYREAAKFRHPDRPTGSEEAMAELNRARDEALKELG